MLNTGATRTRSTFQHTAPASFHRSQLHVPPDYIWQRIPTNPPARFGLLVDELWNEKINTRDKTLPVLAAKAAQRVIREGVESGGGGGVYQHPKCVL